MARLDADRNRRERRARRAVSSTPRLPALLWAHPDADEGSPLLVAHDGPKYAEHSSLLTLLGRLPPLRAALIGPVNRNETYSASARYARALVEEILPVLPPAPLRVGLGASLGALALLHAHRRYPESFDALFLQSGSFFRRRDLHERRLPSLPADLPLRRHAPRRRDARGRSRSRSPAATSRRTSRRTSSSQTRCASRATRSTSASSGTATTGSPGATTSIQGSPS